jgi:tRNA modification GTPase
MLAEDCRRPRIVALNKGDLSAAVTASEIAAIAPDARIVEVAARTGEGLPALLSELSALAGAPREDAALTQARHIAAAVAAAEALESACDALDAGQPPDIAAIDLNCAHAALSGIIGADPREAVVEAIFANFCVGK